MCCNADILFSVLVLHWVTSKDKVSTGSSNDTHTATGTGTRAKISAATMGPYSIADKLGVFNASKGGEATVTTHISAQELKNEENEEVDWLASKQRSSIPLGRIKVQVGQVIEVDSRRRSDAPTLRSEGEDVAEVRSSRRMSQGGGSGVSTEELVEQRIEEKWLSTPKYSGAM